MNTVRLYDFETKILTDIPASELAPGYINSQVRGIEGTVFVKASQAKLGLAERIREGRMDHPGSVQQKLGRLRFRVFRQGAGGYMDEPVGRREKVSTRVPRRSRHR